MESNRDKSFYDRDAPQRSADFADWQRVTIRTFDRYRERVRRHFAGRSGLVALELGAGTCTLSLLLSTLQEIDRIHCFDISAKRMQESLEISNRNVGGETAKLHLQEGDFNAPLPFADRSLDLVAFDAALHHARSIWGVLAESWRVLKDDGLLIAQREQFLTQWKARAQLRALSATPEVQAGVAENAYLRCQYEYYLGAAGFAVVFLPVLLQRKHRLLGFANGLLFNQWVMLARKR